MAASAFMNTLFLPLIVDALPEQGWNVVEPLQLVCHGERVSAAVQRRIVAALRAALPSGDGGAEARVTRAAARSRSPA